jgi:hypothetical protein
MFTFAQDRTLRGPNVHGRTLSAAGIEWMPPQMRN